VRKSLIAVSIIAMVGAGIYLLQRPDKDLDMVEFLQAYININTAQPTPDYGSALTFLKRQATRDGFAIQEVPLPSGNKVLVVSQLGTDQALPALALNHHIDVVPIGNQADWKHDPFAGTIESGIIYGRGTQDMKGIGVAQYYALKAIKEAGITLKRTVHLLMVPDEEVGGFKGVNEFVKTEVFSRLNIGFVLDEGVASGADNTLLIKIGERKPIQIRLTSTGTEGHGSKIKCCNAAANLAMLLARIASFQEEQKVRANTIEAGQLLSMNITSLQAGVMRNGTVALNVVPNTATATVDIRVPPSITMQQAHAILDDMMHDFPSIHYEVLATISDPKGSVSVNSPLYHILAKTIEGQGLQAQSFYFEATTDTRYYLACGIQGFGLTPFTCKENLHGVDESITVDDLKLGQRIFYDVIRAFCT